MRHASAREAGQPTGWKIRSEGKKVVRQPSPAGEPNCRFDVTLSQRHPSPGNNDSGVQV